MTRATDRTVPKARIVVWGLLATYPFGGMSWQVLQHLEGFRRLGFDVWYVEDSDRIVCDPVTYWPSTDVSANVAFLARQMERIGLGDRWVFRAPHPGRELFGADAARLRRLYREADAVFNLCGAQEPRPEHETISCRVYLQTDPVVEQVAVTSGHANIIRELDAYQHLFTYAENLGHGDCTIPAHRYRWHPTRPPVCVDWWETTGPPATDAPLTTIGNWRHGDKDLDWQGKRYRWSKDEQFLRFRRVPARAAVPVELALGAIGEHDKAKMRSHGWRVVPSAGLADPDAYRRYIRASRGEFTVAKGQYVHTHSGWFSDRSACYLAAGRPVVTQDTGFSAILPTGVGLLSFETEDEAVEAIRAVASDPARHAVAARDIGFEYFAAERVLAEVCRVVGLV